MANVNSISNSNSYTSSIYGTKNVLSGLASGMDTESMIENSISGYKTKLNQLKQQQDKITWKQDAYRNVIDNLVSLNNKYTSYTSQTNLYSANFFDKSVTETTGANADKVTATGKAESAITINSISKLATGAKYNVSASDIFSNAVGLAASTAIDLSALSGAGQNTNTIDFTLDGATKTINIKDLDTSSTDSLKSSLNEKLADAFGSGKVTADISSDGKLSFAVKEGSSSSLSVSSNESALGLEDGLSNYFDTSKTLGELLGENANFGELTVNGVSVGSFTKDDSIASVLKAINVSDAGVTASYSQLTNEFSFTAKETGVGSKIEFGGDLGDLFSSPASKLSDLFGEDADWSTLKVTTPFTTIYFPDKDENESLSLFANQIVGFGSASLSVMDANGNERSYTLDELKNFVNGSSRVSPANSPNYTAGTDAELNVSINGQNLNLTRSSNTIDIDGLNITLKGTFDEGESVEFNTKTDTDSIMSGIKSFVEDINSALKQIHDSYTTSPNKDSKGNAYDPLTEDEKSEMSETAVKNYEEKAKAGLLYQDSDLSSLYTRLVSSVSTGSNAAALRDIGITTSFDNTTKVTSLEIDEDKLRSALDSNPDKVSNIFSKVSDSANSTGGLMENVKKALDDYVSTSVASPGILVRKAGTKLSSVSLLNNTLQSSYNTLDTNVSNMEDKISKKIDYYTRQFTALEKLMSTMNNQSSMLSGLMGY